MRRTGTLMLSAYAVVGAAAAAIAAALGLDPIATRSRLALDGAASVGWSLVLGAILAATTVLASRLLVRRFAWARALHADLRPAICGLDGGTLACVAIASGVGEELLFRGLLTQLVGVVASSVAFGLLHQVRGRARWAWVGWASVMGLLFALLFVLTGSLAGGVLAHALINGANLRFLRDVDPSRDEGAPPPRESPPAKKRLGGLLGRA